MSRRSIVVGGGIAGLTAALLLRRRGYAVTVIERTGELGGLLRSYRSAEGLEFDYGTHFLCRTGIAELDGIIFDGVRTPRWQLLTSVDSCNFFRGQLNHHSPFVDARLLPEAIYRRAMRELDETPDACGSFLNLRDQLERTYGRTFAEVVFSPIMRKFFGEDLESLASNSHLFFGLSRLIVGATEIQRTSKRNSSKVIFGDHDASGLSAASAEIYYPSKGGIGQWIRQLEQKLRTKGVRILLETRVARMELSAGIVSAVELTDGGRIPCDLVVWSGAPIGALRAAGIPHELRSLPPTQVYTTLLHFVANRPLLINAFFLICFDPRFLTFRVTLYSNVQRDDSGPRRLTVEVLSTSVRDERSLALRIASELAEMRIVQDADALRLAHTEVLSDGFPVPTCSLIEQARLDLDTARKAMTNVMFLGKGSGVSFFMVDILSRVHRRCYEVEEDCSLAGSADSYLARQHVVRLQ